MKNLNFKSLALVLFIGASGLWADSINVITREDGSGTRGAFVEIFDLLAKKNGKKIDLTTPRAEVTNSTAIMLTTIKNDKNAIGYISLGSLNASVKALKIDGVAPSVENVKNKTYTISRPFNIITKDKSPLLSDFLAFVSSKEASGVIQKAGYIPNETKPYKASKVSGKMIIAGSSSISPLMEKLTESYMAKNPSVTIELQQSDSSSGINAVKNDIAHIGMVSREISKAELEGNLQGISVKILALDGLAVIINPNNKLENLSKGQVKSIYSAEVRKWSEIK